MISCIIFFDGPISFSFLGVTNIKAIKSHIISNHRFIAKGILISIAVKKGRDIISTKLISETSHFIFHIILVNSFSFQSSLKVSCIKAVLVHEEKEVAKLKNIAPNAKNKNEYQSKNITVDSNINIFAIIIVFLCPNLSEK